MGFLDYSPGFIGYAPGKGCAGRTADTLRIMRSTFKGEKTGSKWVDFREERGDGSSSSGGSSLGEDYEEFSAITLDESGEQLKRYLWAHLEEAEDTKGEWLARLSRREQKEVAARLVRMGDESRGRGEEEEEALELYCWALALREQACEMDDVAIAESLQRVAAVQSVQEEHGDATELHARALAILERAHGAGHPLVVRGLCSLAEAAAKAGVLDQALALYEEAAETSQPEPEDMDGGEKDQQAAAGLAAALSGMAAVRRQLGQRDQALLLYEHALAIQEQSLGPRHADLVRNSNPFAAFARSAC